MCVHIYIYIYTYTCIYPYTCILYYSTYMPESCDEPSITVTTTCTHVPAHKRAMSHVYTYAEQTPNHER